MKQNALAFNSATSFYVAYILAGVSQTSNVWTSPLTFITANILMQLGAKIDFVDIDRDTLNICPDILEQKLKHADR